MTKTTRKLTPYEKTHLARFGKRNIKLNADDHTPVEHITGKVEFAGHVFNVTPNTLIPRIETEELVDIALESIKKFTTKQQLTIADIGTGSGAIGLSVAHKLKARRQPFDLYLSDISNKALAVAKKNALNKYSLNFLKSNLLANYPAEITFDLITANLPYIPTQRISTLPNSVKNHEPHTALDGGPDGLKYIKKLLTEACPRLKPNGAIILEIDETHTKEQLTQTLPNHKKTKVKIKKDQFGKNRFAIIRKKSVKKPE